MSCMTYVYTFSSNRLSLDTFASLFQLKSTICDLLIDMLMFRARQS